MPLSGYLIFISLYQCNLSDTRVGLAALASCLTASNLFNYEPSSGAALPYSAEPQIFATHHPVPGAIGLSGPAS